MLKKNETTAKYKCERNAISDEVNRWKNHKIYKLKV